LRYDIRYKPDELQKEVAKLTPEMLGVHDRNHFDRLLAGALYEIETVKSRAEESGYSFESAQAHETINADPAGRDGCLTRAALFCRRSGVYPFWLSALIASAMPEKLESNALRETIMRRCGMEREVQLVTLIADQSSRAEWKEPERVRQAFEKGFRYEQAYGGCSQCTIAACSEALGIPPEPLFQAATILSGGGAVCTDGSCGSYSGAMIMLGRYVGRSFKGMLADSDDENYARANRMGQKLHERYMQTYGDVRCNAIQERIFGRSFRLYDPDEVKAFGAASAHEEKCPSVVAAASSWVIEILEDEGLIGANP